MRWVLGQCKYAHDAGCALLSVDGQRSIIVPNERIGSRRKHDGGDTAAAVMHALQSVGATLDDVVVSCATTIIIASRHSSASSHGASSLAFPRQASMLKPPGTPRHEVRKPISIRRPMMAAPCTFAVTFARCNGLCARGLTPITARPLAHSIQIPNARIVAPPRARLAHRTGAI